MRSTNFQVRARRSKHTADLTALKPTAVRTTNTNKAQFYRQTLQLPTASTSTALPSPRGRSPASASRSPRHQSPANTVSQRSSSVQNQPRQELTRGQSPALRAQSMPSVLRGKQNQAASQPDRSKMAARRSGHPPHERSRSPSTRSTNTTEEVAETVAASMASKATNTTELNVQQKKRSRSKSKSRERSTSRSRQKLTQVVEDRDSEDESDEEQIPPPLAGVPELEAALGKFQRRRDARRLVLEQRRVEFEKRRREFEQFAMGFKELDNEVFDLEETCLSLERRRNVRVGIAVPSRSHSREQPDNRCYLCKRPHTRVGDVGTENEVTILDPVDPAVVAARVRPEAIVLAAESTPAQYWKSSDAQTTVVDHNRTSSGPTVMDHNRKSSGALISQSRSPQTPSDSAC